MPLVKIFGCSEVNQYDDMYAHTIRIVAEGISDWEEISEEDYKFLDNYMYALRKNFPHAILVVKDKIPVLERITEIKTFIENARLKEEKRKIEADRKRTANVLEKKRKQFLKLQKELDGKT